MAGLSASADHESTRRTSSTTPFTGETSCDPHPEKMSVAAYAECVVPHPAAPTSATGTTYGVVAGVVVDGGGTVGGVLGDVAGTAVPGVVKVETGERSTALDVAVPVRFRSLSSLADDGLHDDTTRSAAPHTVATRQERRRGQMTRFSVDSFGFVSTSSMSSPRVRVLAANPDDNQRLLRRGLTLQRSPCEFVMDSSASERLTWWDFAGALRWLQHRSWCSQVAPVVAASR